MAKKQQYLVIHCTATPEGREVTSDDIRRWHTDPKPQGNGWKQVGYTHMIHLDGKLEQLVANNNDDIVDSWEITNGAKGYNSVSRHIVYVGGTEKGDTTKAKDTRTEAQKATLESYVKDFHSRYPNVKIVGHNHFAAKACPSFDVQEWLKQIGINQTL